MAMADLNTWFICKLGYIEILDEAFYSESNGNGADNADTVGKTDDHSYLSDDLLVS